MDEKARLKEIVLILKDSNLIKNPTPKKASETLTKLGPTFIKLGQIMSSRYDILPKEYCDEFAKLRSNVEPMSYADVMQILKEEYKHVDEIFEKVNIKCIGSASIAQVHKAKLKTGENVVIKVQRKNIYEKMTTDINLFKKATKLLHLNMLIKFVDLNKMLDEIYCSVKEEMNFEIEAKHMIEYRNNNKEIAYVSAPKVYEELTNRRVLVMEYIKGHSLMSREALSEEGYDLEEIGLKLANNYIKQALYDGFFHADPHSDNISIRDGKIVFLDWGIAGRLNGRDRELLKKALKAILNNDMFELEHILECFSTSSDIDDHSKLRDDLRKILQKNATQDLNNINIIDFTSSLSKVLRNNNIKLEKDITLLMRGICIIKGTLEELSPNINLMMVINNKLQEDGMDSLFSRDALINTGKNVVSSVNSLSVLPTEILNFVRDMNDGEKKFSIEMANSQKQVDKLEKMLHQLIIGVIDAALLLGASIVQSETIRVIYIILAFILSTWIFAQMLKDHVHKGY